MPVMSGMSNEIEGTYNLESGYGTGLAIGTAFIFLTIAIYPSCNFPQRFLFFFIKSPSLKQNCLESKNTIFCSA